MPRRIILDLPISLKRCIVMSVDAVLCVAAIYLAYALRLLSWPVFSFSQLIAIVWAFAAYLTIFCCFGLYRQIFRYTDWASLKPIFQVFGIYLFVFGGGTMAAGYPGVPRTIGILHAVVFGLSVLGSRLAAGSILVPAQHPSRVRSRRRVVIYGAGSAGRQHFASIHASAEMVPVAFLDDDPRLSGRTVLGKKVYPSDQVASVCARYGADQIILAIPSASRTRRLEIVERLKEEGLEIMTLPGIAELADGKIRINDLREVDIVDLLGRDIVSPDPDLMHQNILGKVVMVTGSGGSIGSELCRQIVNYGPSKLLLVDNSEYALYAIHQELLSVVTRMDRPVELVPFIASVCDAARMAGIMAVWNPATIYHAAAYKHVPLVEQNPAEGVRNNVFGTMTLALVARDHGVEDFILISTDKAVRPTNIMGASKRLAEIVLQALSRETSTTRFAMVRFGNVLGSSGSVVPLFREQIRKGGPITITHPEVTRYFMTIPEAAQLVIQAAAMAHSGEVFLLDMGEPVRIYDLAVNMIRLSGLTVRDEHHLDGDIEVRDVGLRPGEKLFEELLIGNEPSPTRHPRIFRASEPSFDWEELNPILRHINDAIEASDTRKLIGGLSKAVIEYKPERDIHDWVHVGTGADTQLIRAVAQ